MARPLRIEYPGALYHITSRGNKCERIFTYDQDRKRFLDILYSVLTTHHWICHAYCLMDNHYHLLIETQDSNLSVGMRDLNGIYTQTYNATHSTIGHLLQGRYKAFLIEKETYFLEVARYVVLNPVRARMVKQPYEWDWSSYQGTVETDLAHRCLHPHDLLNLFSPRKLEARMKYKKFVEEGMSQHSPFDEVQHGTILGSQRFVMETWERNPNVEELTEVIIPERMIARPTLNTLFDDVKTVGERDRLMVLARVRCGYSVSEIAKHLLIHRTTVSKILNKNNQTLHPTT